MPLPGLPPASSSFVVSVSLVEAPRLLSGSSKTPALPVLVNWFHNPVDPWVPADSLVLGVDQDDLIIFVSRVLIDPVRIKDTQVCTTAPDTLLSSGPERALVFELVHTLICRLAIGSPLGDRSLAASTAHADAVDDITLFGLVAESTSLVGAGWAGGTVADL